MNPERQRIHQTFSRTESALRSKKITKEEHDAFLLHTYGTIHEYEAVQQLETKNISDGDGAGFTHRSVLLMSGFFVIMFSLFAVLFYSTGGITGAVTFEQIDQTFMTNGTINLTLNGTTHVNVTGVHSGRANTHVTLEINGETYLVSERLLGSVQTAHVSLERSWYLTNETVIWSARNVSSAYLDDGETMSPLGNVTQLENLVPGTYVLKFIINDTQLIQEQLTFTVAESLPEDTMFATCGAACGVNLTGNATLTISVDGDGVVEIESVTLSARSNEAPELITQIPDLAGEGHVTLDLSLFFTDVDGDTILYDSSHYDEMNETINGSVLMLSGIPGSYTYVAYASDLKELTSSNIFTVTILTGSTQQNSTNNSLNTSNETTQIPVNTTLNQSSNITTNVSVVGNATNESDMNVSTLCNQSDVNQRPMECLQEQSDIYFQEQTIYITNSNRDPVARFSPIGNLLIKGNVRENALFTATPGDYAVSWENEYGDTITTVWFDSLTGDVYTAGMFYEEEFSLEPAPGSVTFRNKKGVTLAWINPGTGDIHIRGNIIPYRRSIT